MWKGVSYSEGRVKWGRNICFEIWTWSSFLNRYFGLEILVLWMKMIRRLVFFEVGKVGFF